MSNCSLAFALTPERSRTNPFLTFWGQNKTVVILQTAFSNWFSCLKVIVFWFEFRRNWFSFVQSTIEQHWSREWFAPKMPNSLYELMMVSFTDVYMGLSASMSQPSTEVAIYAQDGHVHQQDIFIVRQGYISHHMAEFHPSCPHNHRCHHTPGHVTHRRHFGKQIRGRCHKHRSLQQVVNVRLSF